MMISRSGAISIGVLVGPFVFLAVGLATSFVAQTLLNARGLPAAAL
jgi:hypothetical protein